MQRSCHEFKWRGMRRGKRGALTFLRQPRLASEMGIQFLTVPRFPQSSPSHTSLSWGTVSQPRRGAGERVVVSQGAKGENISLQNSSALGQGGTEPWGGLGGPSWEPPALGVIPSEGCAVPWQPRAAAALVRKASMQCFLCKSWGNPFIFSGA